MQNTVHILGIPGSLRKGSYNKIILKKAAEVVPPTAELEIYEDLVNIPLFNQDDEKNLPESVISFKEKIQRADAILFATPEYNYSIPGVLKNAIDWASRPYGDNAWDKKPAAIMTASTGMLGGVRAQYQLRQIFVFLNMYSFNKPEVIIPAINQKIDSQGNLTDAHTKEKIVELLEMLIDWTVQLKAKVISPEEAGTEEYPYDAYYARSQ